MTIVLQHELPEEDRLRLLEDAARDRSGRQVYRRMAERIRERLEELYVCDLTHAACELACLGLEERKADISPDGLLCLARKRVPLGDVLRRELDWGPFGRSGCSMTSLAPPDWTCYSSHFYIDWLRSQCSMPEVLFSRFWHNCQLAIDYYTSAGTRRKPTLALMGMVPMDIWQRASRARNETIDDDAAHAAVAHEWDLLGEPEFMQVMKLAMHHAEQEGIGRWTAELSCPPDPLSVRVLHHRHDGDDGQLVTRRTPLHDLLLHHMPLWSLSSVSTEEGSSKPVFGLPERHLRITAFRPGVWVSEAGLIARIPRFYSWQALRTHARSDFRALMTAMSREHRRLRRTEDNAFSYARRIRDELRAAGWDDVRALTRAQELSELTDRQILRLGHQGSGGEGRRRRSRV